MDLLLKDRLRIDGLELGAKIGQALGAAVGAAPGIGEGVAIVLDFISGAAPDGLLVSWLFGGVPPHTDQLPLPPPSFLVLRGSASVGPDLPK